MALRRGFKSEANSIAREIRVELGLGQTAPLDVFALASLLSIPLLPLSRLGISTPGAVGHFFDVEPGAFSAVTVFRGNQRIVTYNDRHALSRQTSDIAHELAHALLLHPPVVALDASGCRVWDSEIEEEADWLAAAMLVTEEAAVQIARSGRDLRAAARALGVSQQMLQFRLNVTGARRRAGVRR